MNELSCIIVIALGAARPGAPPSMAPAPASAVIFRTSRRDVAPTMLAIPVSLPDFPLSRDVMVGQSPKSTAREISTARCVSLALPQEEFAADLDHGRAVILDDVGGRI